MNFFKGLLSCDSATDTYQELLYFVFQQHAHLDLRHCPFNYCHLKPASELRDHIRTCPDKVLVERDVMAKGKLY